MRYFLATIRGFIYSFWVNRFRKNITIGPRLKIYNKLSISGRGNLKIGSDCIIDGMRGDKCQFACIDLSSSESVINIGDNVSLYAARLVAKFEISIGNDVTISESVIFDTDYHRIDRTREDPDYEKRDKCKVTIGNRVYIGAKSAVLKGVTIEDDVIVMPGSVVVNSLKTGSVVFGNPARPLQENSN